MNLAAGVVAFLGALAASAPGVAGEATARSSGDEVQAKDAASPATSSFDVHDGLRRLNRARKLALRGGGGDGDPVAASAEVLREVKDVAKGHVNQLDLLLRQYQDDKEAFAASLKSMLGSAQDVASFAKEAREIDPSRADFPLSDGQLAELNDFDLDALHADALVEMINPEIFEEVAANTRQLVDVLDGLDLEALSRDGRRRLFEEGTDAFEFGPNGDDAGSAFNFGPNQGQTTFHPRGFSGPSLTRMFQGMAGNRRHMKMPHNLKSHFNFDSSTNTRRRRLQEHAVCQPECDPRNSSIPFWQCNCERLVQYATNITPYDLAVMFAKKFIQTDESSKNYGRFTMNRTVETLILFDAGDELPEKANRIEALANKMSEDAGQITAGNCDRLLQQFHTAISLNESRQLSIEEVVEAVHTNIKLDLGEIVTEYDGVSELARSNPFVNGSKVDQDIDKIWNQYLAKKADNGCPCIREYILSPDPEASGGPGSGCSLSSVAQSCQSHMDGLLSTPYLDEWREAILPASGDDPSVQCRSVSYAACATFADSFDLLYQRRNKTAHPGENPMRKDSAQPIHPSRGDSALDLVNFPIAHAVSVDEHGVKTLSGYANAKNLERQPGGIAFPGIKAFEGAWSVRGEDKYYTACSNGIKCNELTGSTEKHPVKCCSDVRGSYTLAWSKLGSRDEDDCPDTLILDSTADPDWNPRNPIEYCPPPMTHEDATEFCAAYGGRLCTSKELLRNCAKDVGCTNSDEDPLGVVWATEYSFQYNPTTGCRNSQLDGSSLSSMGMEACDKSTSFLVGKRTSIGSVAGLARLVDKKGPDRMLGKCCLDNPRNSALFGNEFDPSMECKNLGDWHLGIDEDVCEAAGGTWTRSPCVTLQECIADRPANGTDGFSQSFENFASRLDIADASNEDQCGNARQGLGFSQDYDFDTDVCDEFNLRLCDPFFEDLDNATKHQDPTFKDIKYTPVQYPPDPKLPFNNLTEMETFTAAADDPTLDVLKRLQIGQQASWTVYQTAMFITRQLNAQSKTCGAFFIVILGESDPAYNVCVGGFALASIFLLLGEILALVTWDVVSNALVALNQQQTNWAKETYTFLTQHVFGDAKDSKDPWLPKSLDTINSNINDQHTAVRDELQRRHEEMVNDVNKATVKAANDLGCEIFKALNVTTCEPEPAPSTRRRLDGGPPPAAAVGFKVKWPFDDGMGLTDLLKAMHDKVTRMHNAMGIDDKDEPTSAPTPCKRSKKAKQAKLNGSPSTTNLFQTQNNETEAGGTVEDGVVRRNLMHEADAEKMHEKMDTMDKRKRSWIRPRRRWTRSKERWIRSTKRSRLGWALLRARWMRLSERWTH